MPTQKPFTTKTVETKNSIVDDKLKPNAEMHILVGGPYKDAGGEEHRYGHTALRVKTSKSDLTYDFGRYGKIKGTFGESGEGILRVWNVFDPYIQGEVALQRKTTGFVYAIFDHQAFAANNYFEGLIAAGRELPGKSTASRRVYKLATDYNATGPNCTTISMDGAQRAVAQIEKGSEKYNEPGDVLSVAERIALSASGGASRLFLPANLLKFLQASPIKPTKIDIYGKGK